MRHLRIGIRWWLALAFALIAAVTALAVASVFSNRSGDAFRGRAKELVAGNDVLAAQDIFSWTLLGTPLQKAVPRAANTHNLALFVYDTKGRVIGPRISRGVYLRDVPL